MTHRVNVHILGKGPRQDVTGEPGAARSCPPGSEGAGRRRTLAREQRAVLRPYLNEGDWAFEAMRRQTAQGPYEAVHYHRLADDISITVSGHHTKRGWAARALQRLQEVLAPLGVAMNREKTTVVNLRTDEAFAFLGFEVRRVRKRTRNGPFIL